MVRSYGGNRHFQQYFSYILPVSFTGGGNRNTWRKPPTYNNSLTNFITYSCIEYTSRFELTTLVVIGTVYTGSWLSNYHTITTTTPPIKGGLQYKKGVLTEEICQHTTENSQQNPLEIWPTFRPLFELKYQILLWTINIS